MSHTERLLTLKDAARRYPGRKPGQSLSYETVRRWATQGVRGVLLETLRFGGDFRTSEEALARFFSKLSSPSQSHVDGAECSDPDAERSLARLRMEFGIG